MPQIMAHAESTVKTIASEEHLDWAVSYQDAFPATVNSPDAVAAIRRAAGERPVQVVDQPFRWSEDFGHFSLGARGALFGIGAGKTTTDLHNPDYDFPEALIPQGAILLQNLLRQLLS